MSEQRPRLKPPGRTPIKNQGGKKKKAYKVINRTYENKAIILRTVNSCGIAQALLQHFPPLDKRRELVERRSILKWKQQEDFINEMASQPSTRLLSRPPRLGVGTILSPEIEMEIVDLICEAGTPVSNELVISKTLEIARKHNLDTGKFAFSPSWLQGFKKRHKLANGRRTRRRTCLGKATMHPILST